MSVRTTADERIEQAREAVDTATKALLEVVHQGCWGSDGYTEEFTAALEEAYKKLRKVKKLLG